MWCGEIIVACSEIYKNHENIVCEKNVEFLNVRPAST
jgi:hypothetical protein